MRNTTRGYMQMIETAAPAARLWQALVDPVQLAAWHAERAVVEPSAGGRYNVDSRLFGLREAHIDIFDPPRRLCLIYDPAEHWPPIDEGAVVEDFVIDPRGARTVLRVIGSGVPDLRSWDAAYRRLQAGWAVAFAQLARRLEEEAP